MERWWKSKRDFKKNKIRLTWKSTKMLFFSKFSMIKIRKSKKIKKSSTKWWMKNELFSICFPKERQPFYARKKTSSTRRKIWKKWKTGSRRKNVKISESWKASKEFSKIWTEWTLELPNWSEKTENMALAIDLKIYSMKKWVFSKAKSVLTRSSP